MEYRITPSVGLYNARIIMNSSDFKAGIYQAHLIPIHQMTVDVRRNFETFRNPSKADTFISWEAGCDIMDWIPFVSYLHSLGFKENPNLEIL